MTTDPLTMPSHRMEIERMFHKPRTPKTVRIVRPAYIADWTLR